METKRTTGGVFALEERDRVRSPEELDAYIRVIKPGTLILVLALALVLVALVVWGYIGTIPVTMTTNGVAFAEIDRAFSYITYDSDENWLPEDGTSVFDAVKEIYSDSEDAERLDIYVFLDAFDYEADELIGKTAVIRYPGRDPVTGTVIEVNPTPYMREEISREFGGEWTVANCVASDFSRVVRIRLAEEDYEQSGTLVDVTLVTEEVRPISFLLR